MIEKIMKAVKRSSKRRSRNITIGAVVGFLLSCTAVMGAEEYLWIKDDDTGEIKFGTETTEPQLSEDPYKNENSWNAGTGVYINNKILSGIANGKDGGYGRTEGYGVKLDSDILKEFINNGELIGIGGSIGAGIIIGEIRILRVGKTIITNNGILSGKGTDRDGVGMGIYGAGWAFEKIINNGIISMKRIENNVMGIYIIRSGNIINNGMIYGESIIGGAIGIAITGREENNDSLVNDGLISYGANKQVIGIMATGNKKLITNNGLIRLTGENIAGIEIGDGGSRIYSNEGMILNSGMILLNGDNDSEGYGINLMNEKILMNNGVIKAEVTGTEEIYGIYLRKSSDGDIINNGVVIGRGAGDNTGGIFFKNHDENKDITNTGVIYGTKGAIVIDGTDGMGGGTGKSNNYGVLVTEGDEAFTGRSKNNLEEKNYGLYITGVTGIVTKEDEHNFDTPILISSEYANSEDYTSGTLTNLTRKMYVKNAPITDGSGTGTSTESFVFSGSAGEYDNSILNGKGNTLEIVGEEREINGSIINAYETAIKFDDNQSNELTLSGTTINGGVVDDSFAVLGGSNSDTLIIQSGDIAYEDKTRNQNSIINGDINMGGGADTLVIGSGTIVNGNLDGGDNSSKDTLTFGIAQKTRNLSMSTENIKIFNNISNFENINVNANVTLFESANVNGAEEINIGAGGVLNLRIDSTTENSGRYEGHALFGNTGLRINGDTSQVQVDGTITEEENGIYNIGVLNLVTNGLGLNSIIAMDGTTFDDELFVRTNSILDKATLLATNEGTGKVGDIKIEAGKDLKDVVARRVSAGDNYSQLNKIYKGVYSSGNNNFNTLKGILTWNGSGEDYTSVSDSKQMAVLLSYLGNIYTKSPYSYSSELSKRSTEMFRDIVGGNEFRPNLNQWMIMGGLTHADGGTKDTYYGQNYHGFDTGTSDTKADMKLTGAYMLGKYGYSENVTLGIAVGGNKSEAKMDMSKVKGNSGYLGAFAENYRGNLTLKAGTGIQYSEYAVDRRTIGGYSYNDKYSDMAYDIYLNGRYSNPIGENLFLEPYATLSYTYIKQDEADEGNKALAIETDSKSFDYTSAKVGVDLKKVISHEKGKSTLSTGISYTRILDGADEEHITGRFKNGSDFDILVAHKNEHNIGLNAKYALELENGILFDVKGSYSVERDSHNGSGKNKTKGEWIIGAGLGYKF